MKVRRFHFDHDARNFPIQSYIIDLKIQEVPKYSVPTLYICNFWK